MPEFSRLSRPRLISISHPLVDGARRQFADTAVHDACDAVELARMTLEDAMRGRVTTQVALSAEFRAALASEADLDRRARGLEKVLEGLADLGDGPAEELRDQLFPTGSAAFTPSGRNQVAAYTLLADALHAHASHPTLTTLHAHTKPLETALRAFITLLSEKAEVRDDRDESAQTAQEATAELRKALKGLDLRVQVAAGGEDTAGYRAWAGRIVGMG